MNCSFLYLLSILSLINAINGIEQVYGSSIECGFYQDCLSCSSISGCGFCGTSNQCIAGGWFEPLNQTECHSKEYLYRQCYVPNSHLFRGSVLGIVSIFLALSIYCLWVCLRSVFTPAEKVYLLPEHDRRVSYSAIWEEPEADPNQAQPLSWESWFIRDKQANVIKKHIDADSVETSSTTSSILGGSPETGTWLARKRDLIDKYLNSGYRRR